LPEILVETEQGIERKGKENLPATRAEIELK
jgi:hypothetical protein